MSRTGRKKLIGDTYAIRSASYSRTMYCAARQGGGGIMSRESDRSMEG